MKIKVKNCARCGQDHDVDFAQYKTPFYLGNFMVTHWGMCPNQNEPILMFMQVMFEDEKKSDTIPLTEKDVKAYLDKCILSWREMMEEDGQVAQYYVDAYQSVRTSLFGEILK